MSKIEDMAIAKHKKTSLMIQTGFFNIKF